MCDFSNNGSSCGDDAGQCNFSNKGNSCDDDGDESTAATTAATAAAYENSAFIYPSSLQA